jgi:hypothetical protein
VEELADEHLRRHQQVNTIDHPVVVIRGFIGGPFIGIGMQVFDQRNAQRNKRIAPHAESMFALFQEN